MHKFLLYLIRGLVVCYVICHHNCVLWYVVRVFPSSASNLCSGKVCVLSRLYVIFCLSHKTINSKSSLGTYVFFYVKKEVSKDMYYLPSPPQKNKLSSVELALTSTADYSKACVYESIFSTPTLPLERRRRRRRRQFLRIDEGTDAGTGQLLSLARASSSRAALHCWMPPRQAPSN